MSVLFTVILIVLLALCGEWRASIRAEADILANECTLTVNVFGLSVIRVRISLDGFMPAQRYLWLKANGNRIGISLTADASVKDSIVNYLNNPLAGAIDVKTLFVKVRLGAAGFDAESALAVQFVRLLLAAGVTMLKGMQRVEFRSDVRTAKDNAAKLYVFGIIGVSPANIIYSFAAAFAKKRLSSAGKRGEKRRENT